MSSIYLSLDEVGVLSFSDRIKAFLPPRKGGASVLTVSAKSLSVATVNKYLEINQKGML